MKRLSIVCVLLLAVTNRYPVIVHLRIAPPG